MQIQRVKQIQTFLQNTGYRALLCRTPQHMVMLTGYQPVLGNSFCLFSLNADGDLEVRLAVPEDERDLVPPGTALECHTFAVETMGYIGSALEAVSEPLAKMLQAARVGRNDIVGYEGAVEPLMPAYTQLGVPSPEMVELLQELRPECQFRNITAFLTELASLKTPEELAAIRRAEAIAYQGFQVARAAIAVGATEADVAAAGYAGLLRAGYALPDAHHVQPHVHVMAGTRAALAYRAFNLTSNAALARGDTVLVQMEIGVNGYWAELTRTFFVREVSDEWSKAHRACVEAQDAALAWIRAGTKARMVDAVARQVLERAGLGDAFKHGLGHGFGFQAINHAAEPILHPVSPTVLASGMVHNMEPAVYLEGKGGIRLNDNVAVLDEGNEVLSQAIPRTLDWLVV